MERKENKNQLIHIAKQPLVRVSKTLAITGKLLNEIENREPRDDFRVSIPDEGFQEYLKDIGVEVENGAVAYVHIKNIKQIHCSLCRMTVNGWERGIEEGIEILSLEGINFFKSLTSLDCSEQKISNLNVSQNLELEELDCWGNNLTSLDVSNNSHLTSLICSYNQIDNLNLSQNRKLTDLFCHKNNLTNLDVRNNISLTNLDCGYNPISKLEISQNTNLTSLICWSLEKLSTLDVSQNVKLEELDCQGNQLSSLDISKNLELVTLRCQGNKLKDVDTSNNPKLTTFLI